MVINKRSVLVISFVIFIITLQPLFAQKLTTKSRSEVGFMLGGSHYFGDLSQEKQYRFTSPAAQFLVRYNLNPRLAIRANFSLGKIYGMDSKSSSPLLVNRNLSFKSIIVEAAGGIEFNYLKYQLGSKKYMFTHYILAQVGVFYMNPKAELDGRWYSLRDIGTEGQGTSLSNQKRYNLLQMCIPLGLGIKFSPHDRFSFGLEYGIRMTFTDYLDDVKSDTYISKTRMTNENSEIAGKLANRSLDQNDYGVRGNSNTKDWYSFFGFTMTIQLGKHNACVQP